MIKEEKDLRMVFWVPYNISEIQKGIQAGHCALEYVNEMTKTENINDLFIWKEYVENHKTWMIYNGGTTNDKRDNESEFIGTLNQIPRELRKFEIEFATFQEPDLNNALTAVCCIIDYNKLDFETPIEEVDELSKFIRGFKFA